MVQHSSFVTTMIMLCDEQHTRHFNSSLYHHQPLVSGYPSPEKGGYLITQQPLQTRCDDQQVPIHRENEPSQIGEITAIAPPFHSLRIALFDAHSLRMEPGEGEEWMGRS